MGVEVKYCLLGINLLHPRNAASYVCGKAHNSEYQAPLRYAKIDSRRSPTSGTCKTLYVISDVLDKGEDLLITLKSLKSMLKNMMNGLMQIDLPICPKSKP